MAKEIDVRGLSCPQPVIDLKRVINEGESDILVVADDAVAAENCKRMAESEGYLVTVGQDGPDFKLSISKTE